MNTGAKISAVNKLDSLGAEIQTKDTLWVSLWHWYCEAGRGSGVEPCFCLW